MSEALEKDPYNWGDTRTLYVVLQGEFALYHKVDKHADHDKLLIMAPRVKEHKYRAGPWPSDWKNDESTYLPEGSYLELKYAFGEKKTKMEHGSQHSTRVIPEECGDIFFRLGPETPYPGKAAFTIEAPVPLAIIPGLMQSTRSVYITVHHGEDADTYPSVTPNPTVIPILVYKYYDDNVPVLTDGARGRWYPGGPHQSEFKSLQVYASGITQNDEVGHAREAFKAMASLLDVDADINWDKDAKFRNQFATPPAGLAWAQVNLFLFQAQEWWDESAYKRKMLTWDDVPEYDPVTKAQIRLLASDSGDCGPGTGGH